MKSYTVLCVLLVFGLSFSCTKQGANVAMKSDEEEAASIKKVIANVTQAINSRDQKAMVVNYVPHNNALLIGPGFSAKKGEFASREQYVQNLWGMFNNLKSFKSTPNNDIKVKIFGNVANVALTGRNEAVDQEGRTGSSEWLWTVQMEKVGNQWLIRNDNLKFFPAGEIQQINGLAERAACCLASISPVIEMKDLGLRMTTKFPVEWYSKVETIPPVNYTASVSLTPTPLVSDSREVGRLLHGVVKFREVVHHEQLTGSEQNDSPLARNK